MHRVFTAFMVGVAVSAATSVSAQVTGFSLVPVDNGGIVPGVTLDFTIDFDGQWSGSQLLLNLESGGIYRDPFGDPNGGKPMPAFFPTFPTLEFDTAIQAGGVGAGAVDLGGAPARVFPPAGTTDATAISIAWNPAGGDIFADQTDFRTFRLTVSPDAFGTFSYLASAGGEITVVQGFIPEPATAGVLGLGALALMGRRRTAFA